MAEPSVLELMGIGIIAIASCFGGMILLMYTTKWADNFHK